MPQYSLKRWKHPSTRQKRIYLNGPSLKAKIWLEQAGSGCRIQHRFDHLKDFGTIMYEEPFCQNINGQIQQMVVELVRRAVTEYMDYEEGEIAVSNLSWDELWQNALDD